MKSLPPIFRSSWYTRMRSAMKRDEGGGYDSATYLEEENSGPAGGRWPSRLELDAEEEACWPGLVKILKEYSREHSAKKTTPKEKKWELLFSSLQIFYETICPTK